MKMKYSTQSTFFGLSLKRLKDLNALLFSFKNLQNLKIALDKQALIVFLLKACSKSCPILFLDFAKTAIFSNLQRVKKFI